MSLDLPVRRLRRPKKQFPFVYVWVVFGAGILGLALAIWAASTADNRTAEDIARQEVVVASKRAVLARMRFPHEAKFNGDEGTARDKVTGNWYVIGTVTGKNALGAALKTEWRTEVEYKGGTATVRIVEIDN